MNTRSLILLLAFVISFSAFADNSDYVWNDQFTAKLAKAKDGDRRAQYDLGNMYIKGQGTTKDTKTAFDWIGKSAKQGYVKAKYKLGFMNLNGIGTAKNLRTANKWLSQAASENYAPAQFALAGMYVDGLHVKQDYAEAITWLKKAKASGFWKANSELKRISALAKRAPRKIAKAAPQAPRKAVAKKPARKKVERGEPALSAIVLAGNWLQRGKPSKFLPSKVNDCQLREAGIFCTSNELKGQSGSSRFSYRIEVVMRDFTEAGEFSATYRNNILSVEQIQVAAAVPDETDEDEEVSAEEQAEREQARASRQISTGLQATIHTLECQLENVKAINCIKDHGRSIKLTSR